MKNILLILISVFMILNCTVSSYAAEAATAHTEEESEAAEYKFPVIKPEFFLFSGYRMTGLSGSERAAEYEYFKDSIVLGGELRVIQLPHRLHFDLDIKNKKDFFGDLSYAYKDIVVFRGINSTLFHNLDNITLIDLNPATASPGVAVSDMGVDNGLRVSMNNIFLRFKTPDFPFHIYLKGSIIDKDGEQQQRSLLGAAYFNRIIRASQQRDVDWQTRNFVVGANSHLGPVEVDISHGEKRFHVSGNNVLYDNYIQAGFGPPPGTRPAGEYPHNLVPELKSSSNTLKIHTSHTGKLVAAATFTKIDKENRDSGAKADYFIGSGEITWMPITNLTFLLKYQHKETDIDNPDTASITNRTTAATITYPVRNSISSVNDKVSLTARYRPVSGLTLRGEYSYEHIDRKDHEAWEIPETTARNIISLSADIRVVRNLKLKAKYTHKDINDPAYNIEPNRSDVGNISLSWIPIPSLSTLLSYSITKENRTTDLHYLDENRNIIPGAENRDAKRDRLLGSVTLLILKDLSLTASYAYMHNRVKQDIAYLESPPPFPAPQIGIPRVDSDVPYKDTAHNYALDLNYMPKNNITLAAGVSHTIGKGTFRPDEANLTQPVSIASFSELKIKETAYSASGEYRFKHGIATGIQYLYSRFTDAVDSRHDDVSDGRAYRILLTLSKKW